jgi:micrococcal nuclease
VKRAVSLFAIGLIAGLLLARCPLPSGRTVSPEAGRGGFEESWVGPCRVVHVVDGDTLDVRCTAGEERLRLLRIDTPERNEWGHRESTRALRELVSRREVHLTFEKPGIPVRGHHGRLLAYLFVEGRNVNVEMVRGGWSPFWTKFGEGRFAAEFIEAEREARAAGRGLWGRGGE